MLPVHVELVVVEAVLLVPQAGAAERVHRVGDGDEVLEELGGDVLVGRVLAAPAPAPSTASWRSRTPSTRCRRPARGGRRWAAAASGRRRRCCPARGSRRRRGCRPSGSLRFTHQVKLSSSFWKPRSRKSRSRCPRGAGHLVDAPARPRRAPAGSRRRRRTRRPGSARSGACTTRAGTAASCSLAKSRIDPRERDHVEGEVPGRVPGVLPLVRHRDDVAVVEVRPVAVAAVARGRPAAAAAPGSPSSQSLDDVVVELLASRAARRSAWRSTRRSSSVGVPAACASA